MSRPFASAPGPPPADPALHARGQDLPLQFIGTEGDDLYLAGFQNNFGRSKAGNDTVFLMGGDDRMEGNPGDDLLSGGGGSDALTGHSGDDLLLGGLGTDWIEDGAGTDIVHGGIGGDVLLWSAADNDGTQDMFRRGVGIDFLLMRLRLSDWRDPLFQQELAGWFEAQTTPPGGRLHDPAYGFTSLGLSLHSISGIGIQVDGQWMELTDHPVAAEDDAAYLVKTWGQVTGNLLDKDSVPDLVAALTLGTQPVYGAVTLAADGSITYTLDLADPEVIALGPDATLVDVFTYTVVDANRDRDTATARVEIAGSVPEARFGFAVQGTGMGLAAAAAGDVNGDGLEDVIIAANGFSSQSRAQDSGVYVVFGASGGDPFGDGLNLRDLDGGTGVTFIGETRPDSFASSAAGPGDANGDGLDDLGLVMVGSSDGHGYIAFGQDAGFPARIDMTAFDGTDG